MAFECVSGLSTWPFLGGYAWVILVWFCLFRPGVGLRSWFFDAVFVWFRWVLLVWVCLSGFVCELRFQMSVGLGFARF